ncbi:hypothetical protein LH407_04970 [Antiquaquibacter oligotrophicus]|nr:hypothetical protein [Antiquaquibacter oligotrophicus]UDF14215.1 hypothetical protein LH407_04970 [Antiquaquibacter oligotrophicus]
MPLTYSRELKMLGAVAVAVVVIFAIENIVRGYLLCLVGMCLVDVVDWWRYPLPLLAAALGLGVVLVSIMTTGTRTPEEPMLPTSRRTWATFGPRRGLVVAGVTLVGLAATTVAAGLASSSDENGRFIYLELVAPNTTLEPVRPWFYGWSYGVPVLVSVALLGLVTLGLLSRNAARPYLRADTVASEQGARTTVAAAAVHVATAAALLALAGALRFIARAGNLSSVAVGNSEPYEIVWRYAALASAAGWVAPLLEVAGFTLLLFVGVRSARAVARPERVAEAASP